VTCRIRLDLRKPREDHVAAPGKGLDANATSSAQPARLQQKRAMLSPRRFALGAHARPVRVQPDYSSRSRSMPFGARTGSSSGDEGRSRPRSFAEPPSPFDSAFRSGPRPFARSGSTASSAAMRSPVAASSCSLSAARSSVTSSARSRAREIST